MYKKFFVISLLSIFSLASIEGRTDIQHDNTAFDLGNAFQMTDIIPVVVLGAGPAGYTAAMQTTRAGWPTVIFAGPNPGGQLMGTSSVENYPGIKKVAGTLIPEIMAEQAEEFGATIIEDTVISANLGTWPFMLITEQGKTIRALVLIIATGATPKKLGVPGEERYWGSGVSSCALCDCMFFKDKNVFIVGGGDAAVEEALQLSPFAKNVTILVRSSRMRAVNQMQEKLSDYPHIKRVYNKLVTEVRGDGDSVTELEIQDTQTKKKSIVKADGLFLAIGQTPNTELFHEQLDLLPGGYLALEGRSQATSVPGVFAAGDVEDSEFRQAIVSAGRGCQAGIEAGRWLHTIGLTEQMIKRNQSQLFDLNKTK